MITAHKQQIKFHEGSRRKTSKSLVFRGEEKLPNRRKRRREDDFENAREMSDSDSEFYGFPADSFIFGEHPCEEQVEEIQHSEVPQELRRSNRNVIKKMKRDYVYY